MKAIILAAGKGNRLDPIRGDNPKCLLEINGVSLISRQIRVLRALGIHDITAVVGFGADRVRAQCGPELTYIENRRHAETNSLYSLWLTRHLLADGFLVLNADVLFHSQMLVDLISAPYKDAVLVSYQPGTLMGDEEMKVKVREGVIVEMSKEMNAIEADGENVGIVKFGASGANLLIQLMNVLVRHGNRKAWAPEAFSAFARTRKLHAISTQDYPWIEIDFPEDYATAVNQIFPAITAIDKHFLSVAPVRDKIAIVPRSLSTP